MDFIQVYQQLLLLDKKPKNLLQSTLTKELFVYNGLCYVLKSTLGIFQRMIENILQGIPNVSVRIDGILLIEQTRKFSVLVQVLSKLDKFGVHFKHVNSWSQRLFI